MKIWLAKAARWMFELMLPPRCAGCGCPVDANHTLCPACFGNLDFITPPLCPCCGVPLPAAGSPYLICARCLETKDRHLDFARSRVVYNSGAMRLIFAFKYHDRTELAPLMAKFIRGIPGLDLGGLALVTGVPLHRSRLRERKYNQSMMLAREFADLAGLRCCPDIVVRSRATPPQTELDYRRRQQNVKGAFRVPHPDAVKGQGVLLIDDVITTGAKLEECARALKKAGAAKVAALTFARTVLS